ncbi:transporter [Halosimplex halophilum]|uniref:transporter n=1 Tax=Halosimplex halophilum TaxID=2559572 RepID=UPI00107F7453|nr:transporter [Halosimplex halophilum]
MTDQRSADAERPHEDRRRRTGSPSRRAFLATGAAVSAASLVGCLGSGSTATSTPDAGGEATSGGGGSTAGASATAAGEPEPPWTTDQLADYVDDGAEVTIYAGTGDSQQWYDLVDVINDEFGTSVEATVFASDGAAVSQRLLQERQAGEDKADVISVASNLRDRIKQKGREEGTAYAKEWFEWGIDENFWFTDALPDKRVLPFLVSGFNGGAGVVLPVSTGTFDERGLDYPETYNDLFDDQYEGLEVAFSGYVSSGMIGWITRYHAAQTDMGEMEWIRSLMDRFEVVGVDSHSAGMREVGKGNAAMMLYNWPWAAAPFVRNEDLTVEGIFTDPAKRNATEGGLSINRNAPHPWVARYFVSAMLEKPVQRRILTDVTDQVPVRTDLDLSGIDVDPYTERRLNANLFPIGFWESAEYSTLGQKVVDTGMFEP